MSETNENASVQTGAGQPLYSKSRLLLVLVIIALMGSMIQGRGYQPPKVEDQVLTSRFLGLQYTLPDGWEWGSEDRCEAAEKQAEQTQLSSASDRHCVFTASEGDSEIVLLVEKNGDDGAARVSSMLGSADAVIPAEDAEIAGVPFHRCTAEDGTAVYFCTAKGYLVMLHLNLTADTDAQTVLDGFSAL